MLQHVAENLVHAQQVNKVDITMTTIQSLTSRDYKTKQPSCHFWIEISYTFLIYKLFYPKFSYNNSLKGCYIDLFHSFIVHIMF